MTIPKFPAFPAYASEGDSVTIDYAGFTLRARLYRDDTTDKPDERDDGFWPSLDPKGAGYIGAKSARTLARHMAKAEEVMRAWKADEWFYCGVAVTVERNGVRLTGEFTNALWGVECNYPSKQGNSYLQTVAGEQADAALDEAWQRIDRILEAMKEPA